MVHTRFVGYSQRTDLDRSDGEVDYFGEIASRWRFSREADRAAPAFHLQLTSLGHVAVGKSENLNENNDCCGVAVESGAVPSAIS
jgi:hypothetical protein